MLDYDKRQEKVTLEILHIIQDIMEREINLRAIPVHDFIKTISIPLFSLAYTQCSNLRELSAANTVLAYYNSLTLDTMREALDTLEKEQDND